MRDLTEDLAAARHEAARSDLPADDPYLELMATYVELGELLDAGVTGAEGRQKYAGLVDRLIEISKDQKQYDDQQFAVWVSRITSGGVGVE